MKRRPIDEFWISTNTASRNLGTLEEPFICTTEPEFDRTMNNFPSNCTVHILPGTYHTLGSGIHAAYALKPGQRILGSGMDTTILQLVTNAPSGNCVMGSGWPGYVPGGIEVSDLTLDCHYIPGISGNVTYGGLDLNGTRLTARRVKVVDLVYLDKTVNSEAWGIGFNSFYTVSFNSEGNLIEDCEVSNFVAGTGCSAIALTGGSISGIVRNNRVFLQATNLPLVAFNGANLHDVLVEGNYVNGASVGFYGDTGGYTNVVVAHNTFQNCVYGVHLLNVPRQNLIFCYNTIAIPPSGGTAFWFDSNTSFTNVIIMGNKVRFEGPSAPGSLFLGVNHVSGLVVSDNTVDPVLTSRISDCTGVQINGNSVQMVK
jgi:hypothetical protein